MTTMREQRAAELAATAVARALAHAEDWGTTAAPRRPLNGHSGDCPNRLDGRMRRCSLCRAELIARDARVINGVVVSAESVLAPASSQVPKEEVPQVRAVNECPNNISAPVKPGELRACVRCFYPTTDPEGHCS